MFFVRKTAPNGRREIYFILWKWQVWLTHWSLNQIDISRNPDFSLIVYCKPYLAVIVEYRRFFLRFDRRIPTDFLEKTRLQEKLR